MTLSTFTTPTSGPVTRRSLLGGSLGTVVLLGLSACGSGSGSDGSTGSAPKKRTVQTAKGPVEVPASPKRIVSIQPSATATLYDLGITPVAVYDEGAQYVSPRYLPRWKAADKVGTPGNIDIEKVAALDPDLIVGLDYEWNTSLYGKLSAVAPTVIAGVDTWQATAHTVADAVDKLDDLAALEKKLTSRSAAIKDQYADVLGKYRWDILQGGFDKGKFWLYGPGCDAGTILAAAGMQFAPSSAAVKGKANLALSYERIDTLADADAIGFYANFDDTPNNEAPALFAQPGFKKLAAAKNQRLVPMPDFLPGGYGDALALLDEFEAGLKKLEA
jgi:iron complex transport system substrate-binding protein